MSTGVPKAEEKEDAGDLAPRKPGRKLVRTLLILALPAIGAAAGGFVVWFLLTTALARPGPSDKAQIFTVFSGANAGLIARRLEREGLISHAHLFQGKARMAGAQFTLKAGEYRIPAHASINAIFDQLVSGKTIQHPLTIAEGLTSQEILQILRDNPYLVGEIDEIPPEGTLLPETYMITRGASRKAVLARLHAAMDDLLAREWPRRQHGLPLKSAQEALILASIVEKETGIADERPKVAAVFLNRLRKGMRLESDPTILYGLTGGKPLGRGLRRSEIDKKTAWNTYQIDGLPPTPICNPGRDALLAVLHPAPTDALYFVADGSGGHVFASTYRQHLRNVAHWRKQERQRRRKRR